jgi:saccharopine dehydrogenase-like NADP-dependent oxidoreductase
VIEKYTKSVVSHKKKVLVLGSGYVAGPLIDYILQTPSFSITIASDKEQEALKLAGNRDRVAVRVIDVQESKALSSLISSHDLVVR